MRRLHKQAERLVTEWVWNHSLGLQRKHVYLTNFEDVNFHDLDVEFPKIREELPPRLVDELKNAKKYRMELKKIHVER